MLDTSTLSKIMAFLCSIPPDSKVRLMLQLALTVSVPDDKYEELLNPLVEGRDLKELLLDQNLLALLVEADDELDEAEERMLLEVMEKIGLGEVVSPNMQMVDVLCEYLAEDLVEEIEEIKSSGHVNGQSLLW